SIGVLYDEPFGASAKYTGDNNFTGVADVTGAGAIQTVAQSSLAKTNAKIEDLQNRLENTTDPIAGAAYTQAIESLQTAAQGFGSLEARPSLDLYNSIIQGTQQSIVNTEAQIESLANAGILTGTTLAEAQALLESNKADLAQSVAAR